MSDISPSGTTVRPVPIQRAERRELARVAYQRFADAAATVTAAQWDLPTDCDGWSVRDLVGHVVGSMRAAASMREQTSQLVEIARRTRRGEGAMVDVMTQVEIERTAGCTPAEVVAECRSLVGPATAGRFRPPAAIGRLVRFRVRMGTIDETWRLGYLLDVILTRDAWLHRIDLCRAIGTDPTLTADHDGRIVADVAVEWASRHGRPSCLTLTGPAGGTFASPRDPIVDGATEPDVEAHVLDAVEFCRIVSGRASGTGLLTRPVPF